MIRYTRGSKVTISVGPFKDSSGDVAFPTSVHLTIAYPDYSTSSKWPLGGDDLATTSGISMTTPTTASTAALVGVWRSSWNSAVASPGIVYWTAVPSTESLSYGVVEGKFELRGGLASTRAVASTLA